MKKISLLLSVFIILFSISCTNSDGHDSSKAISAKIDGVTKYFKDITVTEENYPNEGYTDYVITAKQKDDETKLITIMMEKGVIGNDVVYYIQYNDDINYYNTDESPYNASISENSDAKLIGTFSGNLGDDSGGVVQITQGIISINF